MEVRKPENDHLVLAIDPPEKEQISLSPARTKTLRRLNFSKPKSRFDEPNFPFLRQEPFLNPPISFNLQQKKIPVRHLRTLRKRMKMKKSELETKDENGKGEEEEEDQQTSVNRVDIVPHHNYLLNLCPNSRIASS
ncbi:hypothetical protein SDJN03_13123, partial [Cucurbita argyrosperma subsp. sororia]